MKQKTVTFQHNFKHIDVSMTTFEAMEELVTDPVMMTRIVYPLSLFGRIYDVRTLKHLLECSKPSCPFTRKEFTITDVLKPTLFERSVFDVMNKTLNEAERNDAKHQFILFARQYEWYVEGAELGDSECMLPAALKLLEVNRRCESRRFALQAAKSGNMFGWDVLGHISMLEFNYIEAHECFVRCWASPVWKAKPRTAYFIAECYFEREQYKKALYWADRSKLVDSMESIHGVFDSYTLCAQIYYLQNRFELCITNALVAKKVNSLAAFIYAMCALRKVGSFESDEKAKSEGSVLMHQLRAEGYVEAGRFLTDVFVFDTVRNARRNDLRPYAMSA